MDNNNPELLTVREAASRLSVSRATLYKLMSTGDLRAIHIGRSVRLPAGEVTSFVARRIASR
jgi:excisionase family DNA binding protein